MNGHIDKIRITAWNTANKENRTKTAYKPALNTTAVE